MAQRIPAALCLRLPLNALPAGKALSKLDAMRAVTNCGLPVSEPLVGSDR